MKAHLNEYSALCTVYSANVYSALAHLVLQSDWCLVVLFMPVITSSLAHGRQNIDKLFLVNSYLAGCCIAKIASRRRHLLVLCTRVCKLSTAATAVQCCQNFDKLLQVNDDVFHCQRLHI